MTVLVQGALMLALAAAAAYGVWEVRRWGTPLGLETVSPRPRRLRARGLLFRLLVLGLWLRGTYLPTPRGGHDRASRLALAHYIGYWMGTALTVLPLIPLALLDARENVRRAQEERRRLRETIIGERTAPRD